MLSRGLQKSDIQHDRRRFLKSMQSTEAAGASVPAKRSFVEIPCPNVNSQRSEASLKSRSQVPNGLSTLSMTTAAIALSYNTRHPLTTASSCSSIPLLGRCCPHHVIALSAVVSVSPLHGPFCDCRQLLSSPLLSNSASPPHLTDSILSSSAHSMTSIQTT